MIQIVGIVGSPRIGGNTERLVSEALRVAEEDGVQTELVRLADKLKNTNSSNGGFEDEEHACL